MMMPSEDRLKGMCRHACPKRNKSPQRGFHLSQVQLLGGMSRETYTMKPLLAAAFAVVLAGCSETSSRVDPMPTVTIRDRGSTSSDFSAQTFAAINAYRRQHGLPALRHHPLLTSLALQHSQQQAAVGVLSHNGKDRRTAYAKSRAGMRGCGENVGLRHKSPSDVVRRWDASPGHRSMMLHPQLRYAGVARHGPYLTFFACG